MTPALPCHDPPLLACPWCLGAPHPPVKVQGGYMVASCPIIPDGWIASSHVLVVDARTRPLQPVKRSPQELWSLRVKPVVMARQQEIVLAPRQSGFRAAVRAR